MKQIAVLGDTLVSGNIFGIQRFTYEILREIDKMNPNTLEFAVVIPEYLEANISFNNIKIIKYGTIKNSFLWRQLCFPDFLKRYGYIGMDLTLGLPYQGCDIVGFFDCTYENYKDNFVTLKEKLKRLSYLVRAKRLIKKSKKIITISQNSKKELLQYYKTTSDKLEIISCAWQHYDRIDKDESIFDKLGLALKEEYFFSLGSGLPHKNILWIVKAAIQNPKYKFILTGSNRFSDYLEKIGIDKIDNIIYTGYISDEEVKALMTNCKAFIHPAFCEGFGMPPLEAISCGAEIIISNSSCLPEIYGDSARYINPTDYAIDIDKILKMNFNKNSEILNKYSWELSAQKLVAILCEI